MNDREKLTALINQFAGGSQQTFASLIGVPRSNVATWMHRGSMTANGREAILDAFPQVSREWLQGTLQPSAEGDICADTFPDARDPLEGMMASPPDTIYFSRHELIPLFEDCRATCGVAEQFEHPETAAEHIRLPGVKGLAALPAEGDSMEPTIHEGDLCIIGDEVPIDSVSPRRIYLIVTRHGHCMFKRIYDEGASSQKLLALSDNPHYTPHAEPFLKADILHVYPLKYVLHDVG
ncbi:MAG: LexA family transcriptional regulator [Prevotellaceae bacterium]|nr:LexA family transcriptional regulator [Prevotellaceae bacterium]